MAKQVTVDREPDTSPESELTPASLRIAPDDDMFGGDVDHYFRVGREALDQVRAARALAGGERVKAVLDLPSGYGRVARWLRAGLPSAHLTASDTHAPAVAYCVEHFGATGVVAAVDGAHWGAMPGPYDVIWCGSLLTHFEHHRWVEHLQRFSARLAANGVLVFTTHGGQALDWLQSGKKDYGLPAEVAARLSESVVSGGFGYANYPAVANYGVSIARPEWVRELIARDTDLRVLDLREAAWDRHQDVVMCTR